jgi:ribulose-phosphate 3-epimerase
MNRPAHNWLSELPKSRLLAEYSMWSADLLHLGDQLVRIEPFADLLHVDVADGHFAPALLFFPDLVYRLRRATAKPIHVHLMVQESILLSQIDQFAEAGADLISIHVEHASMATEALQRISQLGLASGMVVRVETPVTDIVPHLDRLDFVTLLGTAIGVKGQDLHPAATARLTEASTYVAKSNRRIVLAADGGIREATVPLLRKAGAQTVVMGSLAFGASNLEERTNWLHSLER